MVCGMLFESDFRKKYVFIWVPGFDPQKVHTQIKKNSKQICLIILCIIAVRSWTVFGICLIFIIWVYWRPQQSYRSAVYAKKIPGYRPPAPWSADFLLNPKKKPSNPQDMRYTSLCVIIIDVNKDIMRRETWKFWIKT